ncbi:MAG: hypothetical protein ACRDPY_17055 [Streptosporangiaceae bacterium]
MYANTGTGGMLGTGLGLGSFSAAGVIGIMWASLLGTMLIALMVALTHFIPRKMV